MGVMWLFCAMKKVERQRCVLGGSGGDLSRESCRTVQPRHRVATVGDEQCGRDFVIERITGFHPSVSERHAVSENQSTAEIVVVSVIAPDDLVAKMRNKLADVEAQAFAYECNVTDVKLRYIEVMGDAAAGIAKHS